MANLPQATGRVSLAGKPLAEATVEGKVVVVETPWMTMTWFSRPMSFGFALGEAAGLTLVEGVALGEDEAIGVADALGVGVGVLGETELSALCRAVSGRLPT